MDHVSELRNRERQLRARVSGSFSADSGVSPDDREWIMCQLAGMRALFDRHLSEIPAEGREYEEYRLEFDLPLWSYLSRTYEFFYPAAAECAGKSRR